MADIECPLCGHRALRVATRCPHCGADIPPEIRQAAAPPDRSALRPALLLAGVLLAVIAAVALVRGGEGDEAPRAAALPADTTPVPAQTAPLPPFAPPADSVPLAGADSPLALPSAPAPAPAPDPTPEPARPASLLRRYATTWVNLRSGPSGTASVVRVLQPGEAIMVDSLRRGWYRVVSGGRPEGYAHRSNLSASRAEDAAAR